MKQKLTAIWHRVQKLFNNHPWLIYVVIGIALVLAAGVVAAVILSQKTPAPETVKTAKKLAPKPTPPPVFYSPLTGEKVANDAATKQAVTAIMIENSPDARPQSGLKQAGVIYEAIAEGGITRFLTIHQQDKPQIIGPVRSIRLYYVDWLAPYNASVAHIGGSKFALDEVRNGNYRDIDQFFNAGAYWRATDRYAPHNVYTSFAKLDELNSAKGYTTSEFTGFARSDEKPTTPPTATSIAITISSYLYNSSYTYDASTNTYLRSQAGEPHLDREDGQIAPKVVIAMHVDMTRVFEDGYRESITTSGSGEADIFQNGTVIKATWHKNSRGEQLFFTDESGKEVSLARGQTWIAAVPNGSGGVSWQ